MWLSAVLLLTTVLTLLLYVVIAPFLLYFYNLFSYSAIQPQLCNKLSVQCFILGHFGPPITARTQQLT